jgi:ribosomal protein L16 Arg81 hydroxylase
MIDFPFSIADLLQPIGLDTFLARYYEREPLLIDCEHASRYDGLVRPESLEDMIWSTALTGDDMLVVDDCRDIDHEDYTNADGKIDAVRVQRLFDEGATLTLRQLQNKIPAIAQICRSAEQHFSCAFNANLYLSPPNSQGFKTHHDTHDVFVLQIRGSKHWQTYHPALPLPLPGQRYYWESPSEVSPASSFTLRPGDLFYCPRGIPHNARATHEPSVHITLGAAVGTWAELLLEVVADVALRDPALRAGLPPEYATRDLAPERLQKTLQALFARLQLKARPGHVLALMADRFVLDRAALIPDQSRTMRAAATLALDSRVGGRPGLIYRISERRSKVTLICNARQITLPRFAASSLRFALSTAAFMPEELPGPLTDSAKLVLIRRLMREGLVVSLASSTMEDTKPWI